MPRGSSIRHKSGWKLDSGGATVGVGIDAGVGTGVLVKGVCDFGVAVGVFEAVVAAGVGVWVSELSPQAAIANTKIVIERRAKSRAIQPIPFERVISLV